MTAVEARAEKVLGTLVEIKLPSANSSLFSDCFTELKRIESSFSRFLDSSELSKLNSKLGVWQDASDEFLWLLSKADAYRVDTDGNFDVTLKAALDRLGYDKDYSFTQKIEPAPVGGSGPGFQIDWEHGRVLLERQVEFGGLGKGYALDKVAALLDDAGVSHYYINAGGDVYARRDPQFDAWIVLLEHPDDPSRAIGQVELDGRAVAASAPNRRKWGNGLHHLLNAKTGLPSTGVKAIFVLAQNGIEADAYATALFTAGFEAGAALTEKLAVEVLLISSEDKMFSTPGFDAEIYR